LSLSHRYMILSLLSLLILATALSLTRPTTALNPSTPSSSAVSPMSDVTAALAKEEAAEHLNPEMAALYQRMSTGPTVVHCTPLGAPAPSVPGYSLASSKTVHFIRHGQGYHNMLADEYRSLGRTWKQFTTEDSNPYVRPEVFDAPLTHIGRQQASALSPHVSGLSPPPGLILTSPLTRAVQTALMSTSALPASTPFIAVESLREETGVHVCDARRPTSDVAREFPMVDFGALQEDDGLFDGKERESKESVGDRCRGFLEYLRGRAEECVVVATHSGWLMTLFNGATVSGEGMKGWFKTGECRGVQVWWFDKE